MSPLTFIALPQPNESPASVLMRTAAGNGYENLHCMAAALNFGSHDRPNGWQLKGNELLEAIRGTEYLTSADIDRFESAFFERTECSKQSPIRFGNVTIPYRSVAFHLRICPECAKTGFLDKFLHIGWIDTCPLHDAKYIDACPKCGKKIHWLLLNQAVCRCKYDFRQSPTLPGDNKTSRIFQEHILQGDQAFIDRLLKTLNIICIDLNIDRDNLQAIKIAAAISNKSAEDLHNYLEARAQLFPSLNPLAYCSPWLTTSDQWLTDTTIEYLNAHKKSYPTSCSPDCRCSTLQLTFNQLRLSYKLAPNRMKEIINSNKFQMTRQHGVKLYTSSNLCSTLNARLNSIQTYSDAIEFSESVLKSFKSFKEASKILGTNGEELNKAIKLNLLTCHQPPPRFRRLIPTHELLEFPKKYIFLHQLAREIKIKPSSLIELFEFSGIQPLSLPDCLSGEIYLKSEARIITEFLLRVRARQEPTKLRRGLLFLAQELHLRSVVTKELLANKIIEVDLLCSAGRTRDLDDSQVAKALEWRSQHYTLRELSKKFGMSGVALSRRFLFCNYINPIRFADTVIIHESDVNKISQHLAEFLSPSQAANFLNLTVSRVNALVAMATLRPVRPDECGGIHTVTLLRRTDVEAYKIHLDQMRDNL